MRPQRKHSDESRTSQSRQLPYGHKPGTMPGDEGVLFSVYVVREAVCCVARTMYSTLWVQQIDAAILARSMMMMVMLLLAGRIGRAGFKGRATSFWSDRDSFLVSQIKQALIEMEKGNGFTFASGKEARKAEKLLALEFK